MNGLKQTLVAGTLLDAGLGILLLVTPGEVIRLLGATSAGSVGPRLIGLLLLLVAGFGGYAAHDPFRYVGNIMALIAGRTAGAVLLLLSYLPEHAPESYLLLGLAQASLAVFDFTADEPEPQRFELNPITVQVPKDRSIGVIDSSDRKVRKSLYEEFAAAVARKFYDHKVEL